MEGDTEYVSDCVDKMGSIVWKPFVSVPSAQYTVASVRSNITEWGTGAGEVNAVESVVCP